MRNPRLTKRGERIDVCAWNAKRLKDVLAGPEVPPDVGIANRTDQYQKEMQAEDEIADPLGGKWGHWAKILALTDKSQKRARPARNGSV